tara:strand:- start:36073 stop:36246 length:174 start_codon:yes stop_codon:yes gene_type:complete
MSKFIPDFSKKEWNQIADALHEKSRRYIAGDRMFNEYSALADECKRRGESAVPFRVN